MVRGVVDQARDVRGWARSVLDVGKGLERALMSACSVLEMGARMLPSIREMVGSLGVWDMLGIREIVWEGYDTGLDGWIDMARMQEDVEKLISMDEAAGAPNTSRSAC